MRYNISIRHNIAMNNIFSHSATGEHRSRNRIGRNTLVFQVESMVNGTLSLSQNLSNSFPLFDSTNKSQTHVLSHSNVNANGELKTVAMETTRTSVSSSSIVNSIRIFYYYFFDNSVPSCSNIVGLNMTHVAVHALSIEPVISSTVPALPCSGRPNEGSRRKEQIPI